MADLDFLKELLEKSDAPVSNKADYSYRPEFFTGPLKRYEKEMRCQSKITSPNDKACGSSTFLKLEGIPTCMMHALIRMDKMLQEKGE